MTARPLLVFGRFSDERLAMLGGVKRAATWRGGAEDDDGADTDMGLVDRALDAFAAAAEGARAAVAAGVAALRAGRTGVIGLAVTARGVFEAFDLDWRVDVARCGWGESSGTGDLDLGGGLDELCVGVASTTLAAGLFGVAIASASTFLRLLRDVLSMTRVDSEDSAGLSVGGGESANCGGSISG